MAITALPTPPSRQDPVNFNDRADTFLGALPVFATEANALQADVNSKQVIASNAAVTASTGADTATAAAEDAAIAAGEAQSLTMAYQGALAANPVTNKTGGPLSNGDWYINTTTASIRVYLSGSWVTSVSGASGVSSINGQIGDVDGVREVNEAINVSSTPTTMTAGGFYVLTSATTVTLPPSPLDGDWVVVINRSSGNLTVARNGKNIMGLAENLTIDKPNISVKLIYMSTAGGWIFA